MDNWIKWAFAQDVGTGGEKLVLVYLASLVGPAGVGLMDREALAKAVDYEERSIQRILKNLRDAQLLHVHESGLWFGLGKDPLLPPVDLVKPDLLRAATGDRAPDFVTEIELERAGEVLAKYVTEAGDGVLIRFNDVSLRLLQGIVRIAEAARVWEESVAATAAPPPDPVRESTHFKAFMLGGILTEEEAYELAKKRLEAEGLPTDQAAAGNNARSIRRADTPARAAAAASGTGATPAGGRSYLDTTLGRFERIRDILDPAGAEPWADAMTAWTRLEAAENKHTVEGETDAFELLYPAIVTAARRSAGKLTVAQFLDEKAIAGQRAPWDLAIAGGRPDAELQVELATMIDELERVNHPMCQAPPRTTEGALTEPLAAYHLRVLRVHQQLKKLQEMGV